MVLEITGSLQLDLARNCVGATCGRAKNVIHGVLYAVTRLVVEQVGDQGGVGAVGHKCDHDFRKEVRWAWQTIRESRIAIGSVGKQLSVATGEVDILEGDVDRALVLEVRVRRSVKDVDPVHNVFGLIRSEITREHYQHIGLPDAGWIRWVIALRWNKAGVFSANEHETLHLINAEPLG